MEYHICHNDVPKFNFIFNTKIKNYKKNKNELNNFKSQNNSGIRPVWKIKYVTFNFDNNELKCFPHEKLEYLKKQLYSIPGIGNEDDFTEYQYHYNNNNINNKIEQGNLILFENEKIFKKEIENSFDDISDINNYPLLNPLYYISPSIESSVHVSLLTNQIKVKYNPDFTNYILIKNVILKNGLKIKETIHSPFIKVIQANKTNTKISTTTYENQEIDCSNKNDNAIKDYIYSSRNKENNEMIQTSSKYNNTYNKSAYIELSYDKNAKVNDKSITFGMYHPECQSCIQWLKCYFCRYLFDQLDIHSLQFVKQPSYGLINDIFADNYSSKEIYNFSMIFQYHESVESFIFDDIKTILNKINISINKIQTEFLPLSYKEKINKEQINDIDNNDYNLKILLHSITFLLPKLNRASEATYIESRLLKIPGIKYPLKFDFQNRYLTIIYNSYQITIKDIINEMKSYNFDVYTMSDSFRCLTKEEEKSVLNNPFNIYTSKQDTSFIEKCKNSNTLISIEQDEGEKTEICYNSDSDDTNCFLTTNYANSLNSSSSITEYIGNSNDNLEISNSSNRNINYIELRNKIEKRSSDIMDKRFIVYSKIERFFRMCSIFTIISFITPYFFEWVNHATNNVYLRLNIHIECILVFLLSLPVQFYFGSEIHTKTYQIIKSNKCECHYSNENVNNFTKLQYSDDQKNNLDDSIHLNKKKRNYLSRVVILSLISWIIWIYSTLCIFIRLLQLYTNKNTYENVHVYHEYFGTSSLFITCYFVCKLLELSTRQNTIDNISQFMHLKMKKAVLITPLDPTLSNCNTIDEKSLKKEWIETIVDVNELKEGDIIKILPGNRVPYNGSIVYGKTKLDESMISGNTKPVIKSVMDRVVSGAMNIESSIYVKILDATNDCAFYSMINFIEDVQLSKSSFHIFTDCIYKYLIPAIFVISIFTLLVWTFGSFDSDNAYFKDESVKNHYRVEFGLVFSLSVIIIAFPFTIEFTFPIVISIASKIAMKYGILIKDDALTFKKLSQLDIVVFDKDQVITNGNPSIVEVVIDKNFSQYGKDEAFYGILKSLESYSSNVYAKCIRNYIKKVEMSIPDKTLVSWNVLYYHETEGYNIMAKIRSCYSNDIIDVYVGCEKWMIKQKCLSSIDQSRLAVWTEYGYSVLYVAINKTIVGMLSIHDNVRDGTKSLIQCLKEQYHIEPWLLSNDNEKSTVSIAKQIGIDENHCFYNTFPSEKREKITWLQTNYDFHSKSNKNMNSSFKFTNSSFDRELNEYKVYQQESRHYDPFNPYNSSNVFSNYNVIAPIPSTSRKSLETNNFQGVSINKNNNERRVKVEPPEERDNEQLISRTNENKRNMVAYIGTNINDSDVFSAADIGLCLGILNDISLDSSVITTIYHDAQCINKLLHLTKYIINYSYTTIAYILLIHAILLPVATGLLYPYIWLSPIWIIINLILNIAIHYYRANNLKKTNF
ncbi:hypothetical protein BCR36DRAFT_409615 [Piromyces finnis]|uniref:P-type ATPase A domain-containing protein n=1 Tax=Piromyces finnis TaxID=1754191 RepID=A0A1Y1VIZ0_9FUNG|nr:hypothetical protein BCR36DRAFT_409615 [Piromyces finnis]|eukprot:ORX57308.1 hypothetical protein BCR36DRAFT_409615 [Piromyces finnis]